MKHLLAALLAVSLLTACNSGTTRTETPESGPDSLLLSFAFMGCNRVDRHDLASTYTDASSANIGALKRTLDELSGMSRKPDLFFFLGDMVNAETDLPTLDRQLTTWVSDLKTEQFGPFAKSGIELVALPGNHEFLTAVADSNYNEYPLEGAIDVWMRHMGQYMPQNRDQVTDQSGAISKVDQATFAFKRKNVGFIVMNTDTYNPPPPSSQGLYGKEGVIPYTWITDKVAAYRKDPAIQHIFILGHKPAYIGTEGGFNTSHDFLPDGARMWPVLQQNRVAAMLSAHKHYYNREQPGDSATYQIIAGNGGSPSPEFFGYTLINVWKSGKLELTSKGFAADTTCYAIPSTALTMTIDQTTLTWSKNANPYKANLNQLSNSPCTPK